MAARSDSYASGIGRIKEMSARRDDLEFMMEHTPSLILGTPERFVETIKRLESLGYDEVVLRIDGFGHEQNCRAIELVGKYVIPAFKSPRSAVWDNEYEHLGITGIPRNLIQPRFAARRALAAAGFDRDTRGRRSGRITRSAGWIVVSPLSTVLAPPLATGASLSSGRRAWMT